MSSGDINKREAVFLQIICPAYGVGLLDVALASDGSDRGADKDGLHDACDVCIKSNSCS